VIIRNSKLLYLKGILFLLGGILAAAGILIEHPSWRVALLLAITVWCFARAYYFAFYVIEKYADPRFRYAGLWDFVKYLTGVNRREKPLPHHPQESPASPAPRPP
jgi:hypothetical protein